MADKRIGFAVTGSFCTFKMVFPQMERLAQAGYDVTAIMSANAYATDTRFGRAADWVKREFSFLMDMGREELSEVIPEIGSHRITVQGIADLIFEEKGAIILVDYKTDHLPEEEIVEKYRPQLALYRSILMRLLGKEVKETLIYSMYHKKTLKI